MQVCALDVHSSDNEWNFGWASSSTPSCVQSACNSCIHAGFLCVSLQRIGGCWIRHSSCSTGMNVCLSVSALTNETPLHNFFRHAWLSCLNKYEHVLVTLLAITLVEQPVQAQSCLKYVTAICPTMAQPDFPAHLSRSHHQSQSCLSD